jgi:hypothetical protein
MEVTHMMVPALAFAWCLSSMPAAVPPTPAADRGPTATELAVQSDREAAKGRVKLKLVNPSIVAASEAFLSTHYHSPMGTEVTRVVDGRGLVFVLEWHYHPAGFEGAPSGWHKGVTVYH